MVRQVSEPSAVISRSRRRVPARRRPSRFLGALLLLAGIFAGPAAAQDRVDGDRYQNPRYGIQI